MSKASVPRPSRYTHEQAIQLVSTRPFVEVPVIAALLGVSRNLAYEGVKDGTIPSVQVGSRFRIPTSSYREALKLPVASTASEQVAA